MTTNETKNWTSSFLPSFPMYFVNFWKFFVVRMLKTTKNGKKLFSSSLLKRSLHAFVRKSFKLTPNIKFDTFIDFLFSFLHMTKSMCIAVQLRKFFFHNSQLHNKRLLEKSQNPREIRTCSLPIARHKCYPLCHKDVIE